MKTDPYAAALELVLAREREYLALLEEWTMIDSRVRNLPGLVLMSERLKERFSALEAETTVLHPRIEPEHAGAAEEKTRIGPVLRMTKRKDSAMKVFLCGHMDTVLGPVDRSEKGRRTVDGRMWGTGAADAKGGLVVMLAALECFEESPWAQGLGWEVLITPDEEIGSPGSGSVLEEAARRNRFGLVFEPALPDGSLVAERMGSGRFSALIRGRAAHAGREIDYGRNAVEALSDFIAALRPLKRKDRIHINVGAVQGGGPVNIVPERAECRFNVRVRRTEDMDFVQGRIKEVAAATAKRCEVSIEVSGRFNRPPKPLTPENLYLLESLASCGRDLALEIRWTWSGGVCDGNTLLAAGLPNVDSLGPVGDGLHTGQEYVLESSIAERARMAALLLMKFAQKEIPWPPGDGV